jgi:hypothetical protein
MYVEFQFYLAVLTYSPHISFLLVLSVKGAYATGYAVLGATAITTVGLLFV